MNSAAVSTQTVSPSMGQAQKKAKPMNWKFWLIVLLLSGLMGGAYYNHSTHPYVMKGMRSAINLVTPATEPAVPAPTVGFSDPSKTWNGLIPVDLDQEKAIGLKLIAVKEQKEPMKLALSGTTAYDPNSMTQIRLRFDSLVTRVYKDLGDPVQRGDVLVEVYSNELATAKNDFQVKYVQWLFDKRLSETRAELLKKEAISHLVYTETKNTESKDYLEYILAYDKLKVFGLTPEEIEPLKEGLSDDSMPHLQKNQDISQKAKMTLRSPAEGNVIKRDVVQGNFYEPSSVLMVIAPLDHLRVYANVYESDIDLVEKGQEMEIHFPFQDRSIMTTVEKISNQVDPETHAMRVLAKIKNPSDRLKSDMLIGAVLHIRPVEGDTTIARNAMVTTNGKFYVFVKVKSETKVITAEKKEKKEKAEKQTTKDGQAPVEKQIDYFERREIRVRQERGDQVIVSGGLKPGEEVATTGSLILAQMYEDLATLSTGMPL